MTILVTGATGNIGRRVVDHLIDLGANDIRALTTNPAKANLPDGVTPVTGYLGKPESLRAAFDGVDRMYLAPLPQTLGATLELAKAADVEYLVALSGVGYWQTHADAISASDQIRTSATVRDPYPNAVEAVISMDDIARVAATLLVKLEQRHHDRMYAITGPEALTRAQIAEQIGVGIGVGVTLERCSRDEDLAVLRPALGDEAGWYLDTVAGAVDTPQQANRLVEELPGVPAQSVAQWAGQNAALFR